MQHHVYLVGAGQPQSVEDWYEDVGRDEQAQEVGAAQEPVLSPKGVHLRGGAQDGHGRLEGGQQGQRHGQAAHGAISHQELLRQTVLRFKAGTVGGQGGRRLEPTCVVRWRPPEKA